MKTVLHTADSRGHTDHGWLDSYHTFSFANYYNPNRVNFGVLRVLNDDCVAAGKGFGKHPHDNMEIISIPLSGDLEHRDSMGNHGIIISGEIQVMSAGNGITHSEFNANSKNEVRFLQIWVIPNQKNVTPRYDQISLKDIHKPNELFQILSPNADEQGVWIHQNAWFHLGELSAGWIGKYDWKETSNGVYFFVIEGEVTIGGQHLSSRDGLGITESTSVEIITYSATKLLVMEVSMD